MKELVRSAGQGRTLEDLWEAARLVQPLSYRSTAELRDLPSAAQRYFRRAISPGAPPVSSVKLRMHGEIKLAGWHPFTADQVISWNVGMIWQASVRMYGMTVSGSDRLLNGQGAMQWKLFGKVPLVNAAGPDITRSSAGRMNIESLWLPSVLTQPNVQWGHAETDSFIIRFTANQEDAEIEYRVDHSGQLKSISMPRWGNPGGGPYRYVPFGAVVEESASFDGYTIPTRLTVGWFFGTSKFATEGEFFRVTIDHAEYV